MVIYKITNILNNKIYVGKDKRNKLLYFGSGKLINYAIKKYGKHNFKKEILQECQTLKELNESEIYWILKLESYKREIGYNISFGGDGGDTISNNPRRDEISKCHSIKMKEWHILNEHPMQGLHHSEETRKTLSLLSSQEKNGMFGKQHSDESKKQISIKHQGKILSEETKHKISESNIGKEGYWTGKKNEKHSEWMKSNNPFKGRTHTPEVCEKISESHKGKEKSEEHKKKLSIANNGNKPANMKKITINDIEYESLAYASTKTDINYSTLRNRVKSKNIIYQNYKEL